MSGSIHRKRFLMLMVYVVAALPWVVHGAIQATATNRNSPVDWVSEDFPAKATYQAFRDQFAPGDTMVVSWDGCTIDEVRLDEFVARLARDKAFASSDGQRYFDAVECGRTQFQRLVSPPLSLPAEQARQRLTGSLIAPSAKQTCVIITFNERGLLRRSELVPQVLDLASAMFGLAADQIHAAGPVIDGLTADTASEQTMKTFAPLSCLVVLVVARLCLGGWPAAALVLGVSLLCQALTLATIHYCGDSMSALLIVMPPLVQVLAVAGGIHLTNYYFDTLSSQGIGEAVQRAFHMGWLPVALSSATTAVGLGSLMVSELLPVRSFGAYAAAGVMMTLAVLLTLIPGTLMLMGRWSVPRRLRMPVAPVAERLASHEAQAPDCESPSAPKRSKTVWRLWVGCLKRWELPVTLGSLALMSVMGYGAARLRASVRIETLFDGQSRIMQDYAWLEQHVGPLVPIEVIVRFESDCRLDWDQRAALIGEMAEQLHSMDQVGGVLSAATFRSADAGANAGAGDNAGARFVSGAGVGGKENRLPRYLLPLLVQAGLVRQTNDQQSWRITGFVPSLEPLDYGRFIDAVQQNLQQNLQHETEDRDSTSSDTGGQGQSLRASGQQVDRLSGVSLQCTGIMPLVHEIQRQLLHDLFASFVTAFAVIAVVMTLVQAGFIAGLVAMIPNLFPTLILFGALGWWDVAMDIGSVMTASVALGIAVDDTLHFLTFFRRACHAGQSRGQAVLAAFEHCGTAMIQTSLICGLGLLTFALADFVPTARFAWMMLALLTLALIGDLVVLPALLLGPLGRLFIGKIDDSDC